MPTNIELAAELEKERQDKLKLQEMLEKTLSRVERLENPDEKPASEGGLRAMISLYRKDQTEDPKVVLSWKTLKDNVQVLGGSILEDQQTEITLEDESTVKMKLVDFYRQVEKVEVPVDMKASDLMEVQLPNNNGIGYRFKGNAVVTYNGKPYTISPTFLN